MRVKSIALWVLAVLLAAALFYFFRDEMVQKQVRQVSMADRRPVNFAAC